MRACQQEDTPGFLRVGNVPGGSDTEHGLLRVRCEDGGMDQRPNQLGNETLVGPPALAYSISAYLEYTGP